MLFRKIGELIEDHLKNDNGKILLVDGARQVGKTFIIREVGRKLFKNFIEVNMVEDSIGQKLFANTNTTEDFYLKLSLANGARMGRKDETLVFIDEIQEYPNLLTLLKFLREDDRFTYIASGSLLGVTLQETPSIPMGSIRKVRMFPLDFEEFLYANGTTSDFISFLRTSFEERRTLDEPIHNRLMDLFRKYLLTGGLPDAVNAFVEEKNMAKVRNIQNEIHGYYASDASKYDADRKLLIRRIYDMIPSNMEKTKKRVVAKGIEGKDGRTILNYQDEFEYLIGSGIALNVQAISNPVFPLIQSASKNLIKLYLNDVGLLSSILYGNNVLAVMEDNRSINLGALYENVVACELAAHGHNLFYYDNRNKGEVDFIVDDYENLSILPIEVKSGRDFSVHCALNAFIENKGYNVKKAIVLSNNREYKEKNGILYAPVYNAMFL